MKTIIAALAFIVATASGASAERDWPYSEFSNSTADAKPARRMRYRARPRKIARKRRVERKKRAQLTKLTQRQCQPVLSVVGDQAQSTKGAQSQAWKAYQQEARYRYGERYADPRYAELRRMECVHSSIKNVANRATEAIGLNTQFERCSVTAKPCRAGEQ